MQPYVFPYIGYFQMVKAVDVFVFYDDVNFIKQGWINRNKILVGGKEFVFTIPLKDASSFVTIKGTQVNISQYEKWRTKFLRTLVQSYKKAPYFEQIFPLISSVFEQDLTSISDYACKSITSISNYLDLKTRFVLSSVSYGDTKFFDREKRLHEIIARNNSVHYINPVGGMELYKKESFALKNVKLDFIKSKSVNYQQFDNDFIPWLSIIDVLMFNSVEEVNNMLDQYELV